MSNATQPHRGAIACRQSLVSESVRAAKYFPNYWLQQQRIDRNKSGITLQTHGSLSEVG